MVDRGGTRSEQRTNFEQEDLEGTWMYTMCWEILKESKSEKASAAETAYSVLPTAAFLLTAFLQLKDKSRVGGRNCG